MNWEAWLAVAAGAVALAALVLAFVVWRRQRELRRRLEAEAGTEPRARSGGGDAARRDDLLAFVVNPTKTDAEELRAAMNARAEEAGRPEPLWIETTAEDAGVSQARQAVEEGAHLVVAVGGDGTVRAVAEALVGTGVPMAIMAQGTGNLLARNLDLPLGDPTAAAEIAFTGVDRTIDVGWLRVVRFDDEEEAATPDEPDRDHLFLVIAGLGFDAAMVADADEKMKKRVGWVAYFVAGVRHLHGSRTRVHVRLDDQPTATTRLRSLLLGNCGRLPGGITLLPDAVLDDGWLDVAAIDTRAGVAGWAQLLGEVMLQGVGVRNNLAGKIGRIDHTRAKTARIVIPGGEHAQVDGEVVGRVREIAAHVEPGALVVRVARPA